VPTTRANQHGTRLDRIPTHDNRGSRTEATGREFHTSL
jgi:hypothetical protein